ncbi:MAG: hypothetical protein N3B12_09060 [Armatimonadetes bacterium]|nr:hypothetical protein [Armatimonadota bacterium]
MIYTIPLPEHKITQQARLRMGEAIYLLAYLIRSVNWETGRACFTHEEIVRETGFPSRTISRWMTILAEAGEIKAQRVRGGTLVEIIDYEPIARTRGVKWHAPKLASQADTNTPNMAGDHAKNGEFNMPKLADDHARIGGSNIKQILYKVQEQNLFQNASSSSCESSRALSRDQTTPRVTTRDEVRQKLAQLTEEEYQSLEKLAMEDLERDPSPFWRAFVNRDEKGELRIRSSECEYGVRRRMVEILERPAATNL